ncbi:family 16 glycoside hydrolase [Actinotalea sp. C106]|uniref:family 16 glycoside hydrolase n=1 Tax=Actinotalea sp. C106 TaxID=2908644 RepID=UPI0020298510|nr:family 16 glycoside hydrolase [Actinotalea sp. C106]
MRSRTVPRPTGLVGLLGLSLLGAMMTTAALPTPAHADDLPPQQPGVTLRTYVLGAAPQAICDIRPGTTPNVDKRMATIDYTTHEQFGAVDSFRTDVLATLHAPADGEYTFRLTSDDGSRLLLDDQLVVDHDGLHEATAKEGVVSLAAGHHALLVEYFDAGYDQVLRLEWRTPGAEDFVLVPESALSTDRDVVRVTAPGTKYCAGDTDTPGDGLRLDAVHPDYTLTDLLPEGFEPMVSALDWTEDGDLVLVTSGSVSPSGPVPDPEPGEVFVLGNVTGETSAEDVTVTKVATGLLNPMGVAVVDGSIYVSERDRLTELTPDTDGDGLREHRTVAEWPYGENFHEFAFGLLHDEDHFYVTLSVAIDNGGATTDPQPAENRGTSLRIDRETGEVEYVAGGLRTPNGLGWGPGGELFVMDNQGAWLPSSKLVHIKEGRFFNHYTTPAGPFDAQPATAPVLWLPQNEIANSPSNPVLLEEGPFAGQMLFGDVTYGGLQRAFLEEVGGEYQGAAFRHTAGLQAGVNRTVVGPDGAIYVGEIGEAGNWSESGKLDYGLQKLTPTGTDAFDMTSMSVTEDGFAVRYTQPLSEETAQRISADAADGYQVQQWRYVPTQQYGGPKIDEEVLVVQGAEVSSDRRTVRLTIDGLKPDRVVHLRSPRPFTDVGGTELWSTEAWYTLNTIPGYEAPDDLGYHEAEEAQMLGGASIAADHSGYSGSGFTAGLQGPGASVTFTTEVDEAGTVPIHVRYSNGPNPFAGAKQMTLRVNGAQVAPVEFPSTGDWKTWSTLTRDVELQEGTNTISFRYEAGDDGNVNIDVLRVGAEPDICSPITPEDGYTAIFDGTLASLDDWRLAGAGSFGRQSDCSLRTSGGLGLLWYTAQEFEEYSLKLDWKLVKDDNGGVFVGFPNPGDDPWVAVDQGYEIQIDASDAEDRTTGAIYTFQGADVEAVAEALNPVGQWNAYEIEVSEGTIRVHLNGVLVNDFASTDPARDLSSGFIGVQNHGAGEAVSYRDVRIRATASPVRSYELEDGVLDGGAEVGTEHAGYSGTGYVQGFHNPGAGVSTMVAVDAAGTYPVTLRYANGPHPFEGPKTVSVLVDGADRGQLTLPSTGQWTQWSSITTNLVLPQGESAVTLRYADGDDGNVNLDRLRLGEPVPTTAPVTTATVTPEPANGWHTVEPTVTLVAEDDQGVASTEYRVDDGDWLTYEEPFLVAGEGERTVSFRSTGTSGTVEEVSSIVVAVDTVAPEVLLEDGARTYTIDQEVAIGCTATDPAPGSGVASSTCADLASPAWEHGVGSHTLTASATDVAGNVGEASTEVSVTVTYGSLRALVHRFSDRWLVTVGLNTTLTVAEHIRSSTVRHWLLASFDRQVAAQTGRAFTAEESSVLRASAAALP